MRKAGLDPETQKPIIVYYEGEVVGEFVADVIVNDAVIIELKSVRRINKESDP
jgi:GxxExxY protein